MLLPGGWDCPITPINTLCNYTLKQSTAQSWLIQKVVSHWLAAVPLLELKHRSNRQIEPWNSPPRPHTSFRVTPREKQDTLTIPFVILTASITIIGIFYAWDVCQWLLGWKLITSNEMPLAQGEQSKGSLIEQGDQQTNAASSSPHSNLFSERASLRPTEGSITTMNNEWQQAQNLSCAAFNDPPSGSRECSSGNGRTHTLARSSIFTLHVFIWCVCVCACDERTNVPTAHKHSGRTI
jgi:hypothetical protein